MKPVVFWQRDALVQLDDLPPGGQTRRIVAQIKPDGTLAGVKEKAPRLYGRLSGYGNSPPEYLEPLLLAHCPDAHLPDVRMNDAPIRSAGHTAIAVKAQIRPTGAFALPQSAVGVHPVQIKGGRIGYTATRMVGTGRWKNRGLLLDPSGWVILELRLPPGSGAATWNRFMLHVYFGNSCRIQVYDHRLRTWRAAGSALGQKTVPLESPNGLVNPFTDSLLVRVETAGGFRTTVEVGASGHGRIR